MFRPDVLAGKVAFITGGGSGICYGIARAFMEHGADVAIAGRKIDRLAESASALEELTGRTAIAAPCDVRDPAAVAGAVKAVLDRFGRLDIVVNGAAGNFLCPASQLSPNGFRTVLDIDAAGTFNVCRAAFDAALRDRGGVVLNISATLHYSATPLQVHASAAKAAVDAITRTLAVEWGSVGIRVNGIAPGPIDQTEGMSRLAPGDVKQRMIDAIPIRRFGRIDEISSLAVFLCTEAASLIHGATIVADGGAWLGMGRALVSA